MHGGLTDQLGADRAADAVLDGVGTSVPIPEAQFFIKAQFARAGDSLKTSAESGKVFLNSDYFKSNRPAPLVTLDDTTMLGNSVLAIVGPRAQPQIGAVDKVSGNVTVIRNGASIALNVGDQILKSDVVQTGAGSMAVIIMIDGTALVLSADMHMAMNEFWLEPNSTSLLNLPTSSFVFVADQIAPNGGPNIEIQGHYGGTRLNDNDTWRKCATGRKR